jgi:hypothetical protein
MLILDPRNTISQMTFAQVAHVILSLYPDMNQSRLAQYLDIATKRLAHFVHYRAKNIRKNETTVMQRAWDLLEAALRPYMTADAPPEMIGEMAAYLFWELFPDAPANCVGRGNWRQTTRERYPAIQYLLAAKKNAKNTSKLA